MRDIWTVFRFTLRDALRKKAFIITTAIVLVLIVAACAIPGITGLFADDKEETLGTAKPDEAAKTLICYYIDAENSASGALAALQAALPDIEFREGTLPELDTYKADVEENRSSYIVQIIPPASPDSLPSMTVFSKNIMSDLPADAISRVIKAVVVSARMQQAGVSQDLTGMALSEISISSEIVGKMDLSGYILGIVLTMIIFFAVYYYGYGVAMSVASEKTSRVMETLVVSAKPSHILLGKCLAMGVLGILQLASFLICGAVCFTLMVPEGFTIAGMPLALSSFTVQSALLTLLYFVLGYALYAMLNSVCGATVSRTEDLNAAMMPTVLISLLSFYAAYMTIFLPNESFKKIATYVPFTSPFIMPFRLLNETVATGDILISVAFLLLAIVLISALSIRLYSASVLHYGQRLKLKDLFKMHV